MISLESSVIDRVEQRRVVKALTSRDQEAVLERARHLRPEDQLLVKLVVQDRLSQRHVAELLNQPPWKVSRRLKRVGARLHEPIVIALLDPRCTLSRDVPEYVQLLIEHRLQFRSTRELSDLHDMPETAVRSALTFVRGWYRGLTHQLASTRH